MKQTNIFLIFLIVLSILQPELLISQKNPKDTFAFPPLNPVKNPNIQQISLPNGMRLFLVEDHHYPTIDVQVMIYGGSVFDPADKAGLAVMTATVMRTGGAGNMTGDGIDQALDSNAASIESEMFQTSGRISASMLKENQDTVWKILSDILRRPAFGQEKIDLEKISQKTLISRRNDDSGQIYYREFNKLIFGKESPYARHSEYSTINAITRDDMVRFHQRFYHPNNLLLAVGGDFDSREMAVKIKELFGDWQKSAESRPPYPEIQKKEESKVYLVAKSDLNQSSIIIGHVGGYLDNPDYPALILLNSILSGDRIFQRVRTDEGLAYSAWGLYGSAYRTPGIFSAGTQTKSGTTGKAIRIILEEIKKITQAEVTDEEFRRARDNYLNSFVFMFDSKAKIMSRVLALAFNDYPLDFYEQLVKKIEQVTKPDILRAAQKSLKMDQLKILVVGNSADFDYPLDQLGKVYTIDITIPEQ